MVLNYLETAILLNFLWSELPNVQNFFLWSKKETSTNKEKSTTICVPSHVNEVHMGSLDSHRYSAILGLLLANSIPEVHRYLSETCHKFIYVPKLSWRYVAKAALKTPLLNITPPPMSVLASICLPAWRDLEIPRHRDTIPPWRRMHLLI